MAEKTGVNAAVTELGLHSYQFYGWRAKAQLLGSRGQIDQEQAKEIARLKRQLTEKEEELAISRTPALGASFTP